MLVSISKSIKEEGQIYDASRYQWRASLKRAKAVEYVIAHTSGSIKGVFLPEKWLPSNAEEFSGLSDPKDGRIGFIGKPAPAKVLSLYLNNQIPKSYFPKGASNPVRFVEGNGVEKTNSQETRQNEKGEDAAMSNDVDWKSVAEKALIDTSMPCANLTTLTWQKTASMKKCKITWKMLALKMMRAGKETYTSMVMKI